MIGKIIVNDSNESIAQVMGTYHPQFYIHSLQRNQFNVEMEIWNKDWPNWKDKPLLILLYFKPQRNMTKREVAKIFEISEDRITDKLYNALTKEYDTMVVPYDSVKFKDEGKADENKNTHQ